MTGNLTTRREGIRIVVLGTEILTLGGADSYVSMSNEVMIVDNFNMTTRRWTATNLNMESRYYPAVTGVPSTAVGIEVN